MASKSKDQKRREWAAKYEGCIFTALSNLATDWGKIANAESKPGEEWLQEMAKQQQAKYTAALAEFELLF